MSLVMAVRDHGGARTTRAMIRQPLSLPYPVYGMTDSRHRNARRKNRSIRTLTASSMRAARNGREPMATNLQARGALPEYRMNSAVRVRGDTLSW